MLGAFALFALAVWLARGWRRLALRRVGWCFIAAGAGVLIARRLLEPRIVGALVSAESIRPAADAAWMIGTRLLRDVARAMVAYGVVIVLAAWLAGATRPARALRELMAFDLRERPTRAYGTLAIAWLLLLLWGPTPALRQPIPVIGIIGVSVVGLETIRRQAVREFPDVDEDHARALLRHWLNGLRRRPIGPSSDGDGRSRRDRNQARRESDRRTPSREPLRRSEPMDRPRAGQEAVQSGPDPKRRRAGSRAARADRPAGPLRRADAEGADAPGRRPPVARAQLRVGAAARSAPRRDRVLPKDFFARARVARHCSQRPRRRPIQPRETGSPRRHQSTALPRGRSRGRDLRVLGCTRSATSVLPRGQAGFLGWVLVGANELRSKVNKKGVIMSDSSTYRQALRDISGLWWVMLGVGLLSVVAGIIVLVEPGNSLKAIAGDHRGLRPH